MNPTPLCVLLVEDSDDDAWLALDALRRSRRDSRRAPGTSPTVEQGIRYYAPEFRTCTAAQRGAELTQRLLAFARRQPLEPKPIDVKQLVTGMDGLLRRVLTEDIDIRRVQTDDPWSAFVDPAQLEAALLNLAINARDAMPEGGRLTIETANIQLDRDYADRHVEVTPGRYVMLAISDTPGSATILVVEDDDLVRSHVEAQLKLLGYLVITARNGPEALEIIRSEADIDLLFTDVIMPGGMNGRELTEAAAVLRPELKVLYTSGYTENAIIHHGRLDDGVELLQKPYRRIELANKVREVLTR